MPEVIPMGRKTIFYPINPAAIDHLDTHSEVGCQNGSVNTVLRFPQCLLLQLPTESCCATVSGEATLELRINEDAFIEGTEVIDVDEFDIFHDLPVEGRSIEEIPY